MKLFNKISMMALAALAFAACSQDDFTPDVNTTPEEGEKTWAYFTFSFKESMTRADNGDEAAANDGEAAINRAAIYIFKADGSFEVKAERTSIADDKNHIPSVAVEVTSGVKTIVAVLNDNATDERAKTGTTLNAFLAQVENAETSTLYSLTTDATPAIKDMLMTGQVVKTLNPNVSQNDAQDNSNNNHVGISVDRVAAKLDVKSTSLSVGSTSLGTLTRLSYDVLNLHKTPYTLLQSLDNNGIYPTPDYTATSYDAYKGSYYNNSAKTAVEATNLKKFYSLITGTPNNVFGTNVVYLPENTNVLPQKGNSSYVFLKSTFVPATNTYAKFDNNIITATDALASTTPETGSAMYSYDYNFTFQPIAATSIDETQVKQLIAHHIVTNYPVYADLHLDDITTTTPEKLDAGTHKFVYKLISGRDASNGKTCTTISVNRYMPTSSADATSMKDNSFKVNDLTVGLYAWDNTEENKGLICYYRINIFDKTYQNTQSMYYSVIRNNAYHVNITGVSSIGYPEPSDVEVNPETPLIDFPTYMQVEITINQWTAKDMDTSIGM